MTKKTSAHYQREFRQRLRDNGLVKKEVWIKPEHAVKLTELEKSLRQTGSSFDEAKIINEQTQWSSKSLLQALKKSELLLHRQATMELIDGVEPSLHLVMHEYGELPLYLTVCGEQIIVEAMLWSVKSVIDINAFNELVLRTHKYFPLSTISLDKQANGEDYYHMFGALSSRSILLNILFEIDMLASNVIKVTEAYSDYLIAGESE